jgi:regulatory protein
MKRPRPRPETQAPPDANEARRVAVELLARREHSARELRHKLGARGIEPEVAAAAVDALAREGLQSDQRFAESYARVRAERGCGPERIRGELRERGVEDELIREQLDALAVDWRERAEQVRAKRFGADKPRDWKERARQARFLQYRGFGAEQVRALLDESQES